MDLARKLGVRGFPTLFFTDTTGKTEMVYGSKPYSTFENAIIKLHSASSKYNYDKSWKAVFLKYHTLTAKEFSELTETPRSESEKTLNDLTLNGTLEKITTKNGSIWKMKDNSH